VDNDTAGVDALDDDGDDDDELTDPDGGGDVGGDDEVDDDDDDDDDDGEEDVHVDAMAMPIKKGIATRAHRRLFFVRL
jgi:hypothetical protein